MSRFSNEVCVHEWSYGEKVVNGWKLGKCSKCGMGIKKQVESK
jgi:hypothetical protein